MITAQPKGKRPLYSFKSNKICHAVSKLAAPSHKVSAGEAQGKEKMAPRDKFHSLCCVIIQFF